MAGPERVRALLHRVAPLLQAGAVLALAHVAAVRAIVPGLGLFVGPLGVVLSIAGAFGVLGRTILPSVRRPVLPAGVLFLLSALVASAVSLHYVRAVGPSGDEIDYLMMAQSIWREGDLDLRDNFERGDYLEYMGEYGRMPGGTRRADGRSYPTHSPGLPLLIAPAYALGGRQACAVLLALLAAGLGLLVRDLARKSGADEEAALLAWAAAVGPPVLFYTTFLYTEVVIAFCLALALRLLLVSPGPWAAVAAALTLSALPWLHVRMALAAVALGGFAALRLRGRARLAFVLTAGAMAVAYAAYQHSVFGTVSPLARYGGGVPIPIARSTPLRTLVGLFVDGAFGLLPYAPVFLLALAGLPLLFSRGRRDRWALALAGLGALLPVLGWRNWWGFSPPARFTIPLVPVLALAVAARLSADPGRGLARWRWGLVATGLALALFMFVEPWALRMINGRDGPPQAFELLADEVSLSRYLPFVSSRAGSTAPPWEPPPSEARVAALWVGAVGVLLLLDRLARSRDRVDGAFRGLALPLALFLVLSLAVDRWARPEGPPSVARAAPAAAS